LFDKAAAFDSAGSFSGWMCAQEFASRSHMLSLRALKQVRWERVKANPRNPRALREES
jgi:hypothetical protein